MQKVGFRQSDSLTAAPSQGAIFTALLNLQGDPLERYQFFKNLHSNILIALDGTSQANRTEGFTHLVGCVKFTKTSEVIIRIQSADGFFFHIFSPSDKSFSISW